MKKIIVIFLLFNLAHLGFPSTVLADISDPNFCAGPQGGGYYNPVSATSYDYGPDGLVRFHFTLTRDWYGTFTADIYYSSNCTGLGGSSVSTGAIVGIRNLLVKAVPNGGMNSDAYHFEAFNEDTSERDYNLNLTTENPKSSSIIAISIGEPYYGGNWVQTSAVYLKSVRPPKTPILIVPGVLGTEIFKGDELLWPNAKMMTGFDGFMDPMGFKSDLTPIDYSLTPGSVIREKTILGLGLHYTDGLINNLVSQGYTEGLDLFTFPYDWRFGVREKNVESLKGQIDYILNFTHANKVDVVAHSTGGLLIKKFIMDNPTTHHIGKAVFVGVPNLGAPLALKVLTMGDNMGVPGLDPGEFKKIGQNMPVVYHLSPSAGYYEKLGSFFHMSNSAAASFNDQERDVNFTGAVNNLIDQDFINSLGVGENKNLHTTNFDNFDVRTAAVDTYNVTGCKTATLGKFTEVISSDGRASFNFPKVISGDGTVPFGSADSILTDADKTFFVPKILHTGLLGADGPSHQIVNILAGTSLNTQGKILSYGSVSNNPDLCSLKGEYLNIFSPMEINATDSSGNRSAVMPDGSIQNDIPGADFEIWDGHKFMFLPTDDGQKYTVNLKGVGTGPTTIKDDSIDGDQITGSQVFTNIPVTPNFSGQINFPDSSNTTTTISVFSGSGGAPAIFTPSSIVEANASADVLSPVASSTINGILKAPGIYKDAATVILMGTDPILPGQENESSGLLGIEYSLDGGPYQEYISPITIRSNGSHVLTFFAIDKAGNSGLIHSLNFAINNKTGQNSSSAGKCCGPCCPK